MRTYGWLIAAVLLAVILKAILLAANTVPFNSDEAVVALMARHILRGARPVFFYGQSYMGSLDAWLAAAAFKILGEGVLPVRLVQVGLYIGYLLSLWLLARSLFTDRLPATLAVFLGAVPVVLVTTYTTASLGGYGETLVFGNLILWLGYEIAYGKRQESYWAWLVFGLVAGLAFWTLALSLVYLLPVGIIIVRPALVEELGLSLGDRNQALLYGFGFGALGTAQAIGVALVRYGRLRFPPLWAYPGAILNALGTALVDEVAFRGVILGLLLLVGVDPVPAIITQALAYALATRLGAPGRDRYWLALALVMGLCLGWLTVETGSIGAAFLGHAITRIAMFVCTGHAGQLAPRGREVEDSWEFRRPPLGWHPVGGTGEEPPAPGR